jgi:cytochrome P450
MSSPTPRVEPKRVSGAKPETGHFEEFMAHPAFFLMRAYEECGEVAAFDLAGQRNILMTGPAAQEAVFRAPDPTVLSAAAAYQYMVPVFGDGIQYGATFEVERQQTKLMATAVRAGKMKGYADIIAKEVEDWIADWGDSGEIDVLEVFQALVLRTSTHSLMGSDFRAKLTDEFGGLYHELENAVSPEAMLDPYGAGDALKRRDRARARLQELVLDEVRERRRTGRQYDDMIDTFMSSSFDDGSKLAEHLIPGMVVWIMFGGFHTSSNTSAWTLVEFARNPQYARGADGRGRRDLQERRRSLVRLAARDPDARGLHLRDPADAPAALHPGAPGHAALLVQGLHVPGRRHGRLLARTWRIACRRSSPTPSGSTPIASCRTTRSRTSRSGAACASVSATPSRSCRSSR